MRYHNSTIGPLEAVQWLGGKRDGPKVEDLHAMGIPVMGHAPGSTPLVTLFTGLANRPIEKGNWIADLGRDGKPEWTLLTEEGFAALELEPVDEERTPERVAMPGLSSLTLNRVGYRRYDPAAGQWTMRHGGLSVAEMEQAGWEPLYAAHSPDRGRIDG